MLEPHGFDVVAQAATPTTSSARSGLTARCRRDRHPHAAYEHQRPRAAVRIRRTQPGVGVLVVSQYVEATYALKRSYHTLRELGEEALAPA